MRLLQPAMRGALLSCNGWQLLSQGLSYAIAVLGAHPSGPADLASHLHVGAVPWDPGRARAS